MIEKISQLRINTSQASIIFLAIIITTLIGGWFRFYNIENKIFWNDEVCTIYQIRAGTGDIYNEKVITNNSIIPVSKLKSFFQPPDSVSFYKTLDLNYNHFPLYTPLYPFFLFLWIYFFDNLIIAIRTFSAIHGIISIPLFYWLGMELFGKRKIALIMMVLLAISPFHVVFSQEARPYSLWVFYIIFSTCLLLYAIRNPRLIIWTAYGMVTILGCYICLLFPLVILAHALHILTIEKLSFGKLSKFFLIITSLISLPLLMWLPAIINKPIISHLTSLKSFSIKTYYSSILGTFSRFFIDFNFNSSTPLFQLITILLPCFGILLYGFIYFNIRKPKYGYTLILALTISLPIFLLTHDKIMGGHWATGARYYQPTILGLEIMISYLIASKLASQNRKNRLIGSSILTVLIIAGFLSILSMSQKSSWWNKYICRDFDKAAQYVNRYPNPLFLIPSNYSKTWLYGLVNELKDDTNIIFKSEPINHQDLNNWLKIYQNIYIIDRKGKYVSLLQTTDLKITKKSFRYAPITRITYDKS